MFVRKSQVVRVVTATAAAATALVLLFFLLMPVPRPLFSADYSTVVTDRDGEVLRVYLNDDEQWILPPDPSARIPERLRQTVLAFEDRYFYLHPGVNPGAVLRAAYQNLSTGRRVSGASTITMQLARLAEPKPRTLRSKIREAFQAVAIELRYSKEEILAAYLDHAPYGGNIRGIRAAAMKYFGKDPYRGAATAATAARTTDAGTPTTTGVPADRAAGGRAPGAGAYDLTWAEAATLSVLPNMPALAPGVSGPKALEARRNELLERLHARGLMNAEDLRLAKAEPVPESARVLPVRAAHAADLARVSARGTRVATTIDRELQVRLESMLGFHAEYLAREGVENVSALVVDTASGDVVAYAGSQDYFDYSVKGHIDGVRSPRSTGSILKPLLYAAAMDAGMIVGESVLRDIPTQIGAYAPQNIDREFRGLVPADEALVQSLNVPAVRLLAEYGLESFYYFLRDAGLAHLFRRPEDYGLPLILGGAEASPWEIAALYRGLANGGRFGPLRLLSSPENLTIGEAAAADGKLPAEVGTLAGTHGETRLLSEGASYLTLEMLQEVRRPGAEAYWRAFEGGVPVAWKTGTSYGRRDAWAVGVSPQWTVVVWAGNFTGAESPNLSSTTGAGYLLFEIFNAFPRSGLAPPPGSNAERDRRDWFSPPPGSLREVTVCLATGYRATEHCSDTVVTAAPAGAPPLAPCPYHETIYVTADGRHRVDSRCWEPDSVRSESVLLLPPEVAGHIRSAGLEASRVPPWLPDCAPDPSTSTLAVTYPTEGARIFLPRELDGSLQRLTVRAAHQNPDASLYWYLDTRYVGRTTHPHKVSVALERGSYTITCVDDAGARSSVSFVVDVDTGG